MSDGPVIPPAKRLLPFPAQNPAPVDVSGQQFTNRVNALSDAITKTILATLPSNYVSEVIGPNYTLQVRTMADQLARIQLIANEVYENMDFNFTRPEFLYQTLSSLVFPKQDSIPDIEGDVSTRQFMQTMVMLLLEGSKKISVQSGVQLLTDGVVNVREMSAEPGAAIEHQFQFIVESTTFSGMTVGGIPAHTHQYEIDHSGNGLTTAILSVDGSPVPDHVHEIDRCRILKVDGHAHFFLSAFPDDPIRYESNALKTVNALKPAHTLYNFRFLFQDVFRRIIRDASTYQIDEGLFSDESTWGLTDYRYEDARWYWEGAERITSTNGFIWADRITISDTTRSFRSLQKGSPFKILTGSNVGTYEVASVLQIPFPDDFTPRPYTTSGAPAGEAVVEGSIIRDVSMVPQDFGNLPEGATITFLSGPNVGTYRLYAVTGNSGGPLGSPSLSGRSVIPDASLLRLKNRLEVGNETIEYEVEVDKRGRNRPINVSAENVSSQFYI